jgi:hypothetical protein
MRDLIEQMRIIEVFITGSNKNSLFLVVGFGKQIKQISMLSFELGLTPSDTGVIREILEGDYYGTNFNFSKKLLELRISLLYNFYKINL